MSPFGSRTAWILTFCVFIFFRILWLQFESSQNSYLNSAYGHLCAQEGFQPHCGYDLLSDLSNRFLGGATYEQQQWQ